MNESGSLSVMAVVAAVFISSKMIAQAMSTLQMLLVIILMKKHVLALTMKIDKNMSLTV